MAERLSRQSPFDFNQTQMPTIQVQMIKQIVSGKIPISSLSKEVLSPPLLDSEFAPQTMGRFDMPSSERIKRLEAELRNLRAKFAAQEVELNELKINATKQIDTTISIIQSEAQSEIEKSKSELSEANRCLEVMSALNEKVKVAIQTEQVSMPNSATQNEQITQANVGTQTLQAVQPKVATHTEQVRQPEAATQTNEIKPEAPQPMFETFRENLDEVGTCPKPLSQRQNKFTGWSNSLHQTLPTHQGLTVLQFAADFVLIK